MPYRNIHIASNFTGLYDYNEFIDNRIDNLVRYRNENAYRDYFNDRNLESNKDWIGKNTIEEIKNLKQFSFPDKYEVIKEKISGMLSKQMFSKITKRKLAFSENFGVFNFDRVMMGMQRKKELFCKQINKVVSWNEVEMYDKKIQTKEGKHKVEFRNAINEEGKPKIKTSNKKIFVYFPQKPKNQNAIEFFISCGIASSMKTEQAIYKAIPIAILSEELIKKGYKVKITYFEGYSTLNDEIYSFCPIKNFSEPLDVDKLLMMSCDSVFARYNSFKGIIALSDYFDLDIPSNFGRPLKQGHVQSLTENSEYIDYFSQETTKLFIPETWSEDEAIEQIKETINQLSNE